MFRDYGSLAGIWAFGGLFFSAFLLGIPLGIISIYYGIKALRHRESRSSLLFVIFALLLALVDIFFSTTILTTIFRHK